MGISSLIQVFKKYLKGSGSCLGMTLETFFIVITRVGAAMSISG